MNIKKITGGVCAAQGFKAAGINCGIRRRGKKDLALIVADTKCSAACVYTQNLVKGAPVLVTRKNMQDGKAQAIIVNSGNANTCNADGVEIAEAMCALVAEHTGISAEDVVIASTGLIGKPLNLEPIKNGMSSLVAVLGNNSTDAAEAMMTTDTFSKELAMEFELDGKVCKMGSVAKGSGMIHPNMATMLVFVTCDVSISSEMLQQALSEDVKDSFNMISVDGDTSTNDMVSILASGHAGNAEITGPGEAYDTFCRVLSIITGTLCKAIARDGEGATKLLECHVSGAKSEPDAKTIAKAVISSPLVKSAMFGADANWGRVLCAVGYAKAEVDIHKAGVIFKSQNGQLEVYREGHGITFSETEANHVLSADEIIIDISLNDGEAEAVAWGCDLTYDYVKINGAYRSGFLKPTRRYQMNSKFSNSQRAMVLVEALPHIQKYTNKIVVIKYGGNAMVSESLKDSVMGDLVLLSLIGVKVVLVHGGGPEITEMLKRVGKETVFVNGLRVTDSETVEIVQMVLAGKISKNLVNIIGSKGGKAIGLSGMDGGMIQAKPLNPELGYVGDITKINPEPILDVLDKGYIPIISTLGCDEDGNVYNINADTAAARIAGTLRAESLISMTDIAGIMKDKDDPASLITEINTKEAPDLIRDGTITGGMIPKTECCIEAINRGVKKVFIIDGRIPHSILIEILTDEGIGTMFI